MATTSVQERFEVRSDDGTMIPVYKSGTGRAVLLVHGAGGPSAWHDVRPILSQARTVLAIDRRSAFVAPSIRYDLQREFEDIAAVARAADGGVELVGQSSGAVCALGASLLLPNLQRLVLYEPPLVPATQSTLQEMEELLQAGEMEGLAESFLTNTVKLSPKAVAAMKGSPEWRNTVARAPFMLREEAVLRTWHPGPDAFRGLKAKVLFLAGDRTPANHHHRGYIGLLREAGVDLQVVEIPGQEHAAHREAPEQFTKLVLEFLEAD